MSEKKKSERVRDMLITDRNVDAKFVANEIGCAIGTVYAIKRKLFPEKKRKYKRAKAKDKLTIKVFPSKASVGVVDMVNSPDHYTQGGIETYDFIKAKGLSYELGNVVKYVSRANHKGKRLEDLQKARWYLDAAIKQEEAR